MVKIEHCCQPRSANGLRDHLIAAMAVVLAHREAPGRSRFEKAFRPSLLGRFGHTALMTFIYTQKAIIALNSAPD